MVNINICVIGGGVIGLSTAVNIIENISDVKVDIIAEKFSPHTTSDIAGGWWEPHDVKDLTNTEILALSEITFNYVRELSASEHAAEVGAFMASCFKLSQYKMEAPAFKDIVYGYREMNKAEIANFEGVSFGIAYTSVVLECEKYLPWLTKRFVKRGGRLLKRKVSSISELAAQYDIVVNCTGMGACDLVHDKEVKPGRGQMIRVNAPWIKHTMENIDSFAYIIPRSDHVLLGGTYEEGNFDETPNLETRKKIMADCVKLEPSLKYAKFEGDLVGLRPCRYTVRLEAEVVLTEDKKLQVIHNYGHSGSGVTLHWGCAQKASSLVQEAVHRIRTQSKL